METEVASGITLLTASTQEAELTRRRRQRVGLPEMQMLDREPTITIENKYGNPEVIDLTKSRIRGMRKLEEGRQTSNRKRQRTRAISDYFPVTATRRPSPGPRAAGVFRGWFFDRIDSEEPVDPALVETLYCAGWLPRKCYVKALLKNHKKARVCAKLFSPNRKKVIVRRSGKHTLLCTSRSAFQVLREAGLVRGNWPS